MKRDADKRPSSRLPSAPSHASVPARQPEVISLALIRRLSDGLHAIAEHAEALTFAGTASGTFEPINTCHQSTVSSGLDVRPNLVTLPVMLCAFLAGSCVETASGRNPQDC